MASQPSTSRDEQNGAGRLYVDNPENGVTSRYDEVDKYWKRDEKRLEEERLEVERFYRIDNSNTLHRPPVEFTGEDMVEKWQKIDNYWKLEDQRLKDQRIAGEKRHAIEKEKEKTSERGNQKRKAVEFMQYLKRPHYDLEAEMAAHKEKVDKQYR